ncbi:hypothetical protein THRCLA_11833 [Thraustotheca clavata]|uniref:Fibronectin type-III domain-containing protein n=1 Tax=Thraustotheca clavata TaxID=74557 RepID=A0A1V9Y6J4_9STRA|nr:hypothetical protein THRCLA_11833 [Thraustotheca clavata]
MQCSDTLAIVNAILINQHDQELSLALKNVLEKRKVYQETSAKQVQREAFNQQKDEKIAQKTPKDDLMQIVALKTIDDFIDPIVSSQNKLPIHENHVFTALIVVVTSFKSNLPPIPKSARIAAEELYEYLTDPMLGGLKKADCKLLINPSVVEFNIELDSFKNFSSNASSFTLILISHGVRVLNGPHIGSFILFPESRLSSIDELSLTAVSERKDMLEIPSKFKFLCFDICQDQDIAPNIHDVPIKGRIHAEFATRLLGLLREFDTQEKLAQGISKSSEPLPIIILEACKARLQIALLDSNDKNAQSLFIRSLLDAFRGGAASQGTKDYGKNWSEDDSKLPYLYVRDIIQYVISRVQFDAYQYIQKKEEQRTAITTGLEISQDQTPQLTCDVKDIEFPLSMAPRLVYKLFHQLISALGPPTVVPKAPKVLHTPTPSSITVSWDQVLPREELLPSSPIVGYKVEIKGIGKACEKWQLVGTKLVHTYDQVVREKILPPSTITAVALIPDAGYHFRLRARNVGGWGPYSPPSEPIWTKSGSTSLSSLGAKAVYESGALDIVCEALRKFPEDVELQLAGVQVVGQLVIHYDIRTCFSSIQVGATKFLLENITKKFPPTLYMNLHTTTLSVHHLLLHPARRQLKKNEAAMRIQARRTLQELAVQLYQQVYDAASGTVYYYNIRTGEASWTAPAALT